MLQSNAESGRLLIQLIGSTTWRKVALSLQAAGASCAVANVNLLNVPGICAQDVDTVDSLCSRSPAS